MVELNTKYKIGKRRFGIINWIGFYSLYKKETLRFLIVFVLSDCTGGFWPSIAFVVGGAPTLCLFLQGWNILCICLTICPSTASKDMSRKVCVDPTNHTWIPIGHPKNVVVAWLTSCAAAVDHFCHPAVLVLGLTRSLINPHDDCHARFHIQEPRLRLARSFGRGDVIGWLKQLVLKYWLR